MQYYISMDEFEAMDAIVHITKSIQSLYDKMYKLEIEGKKNTDDYHKLLEYLKMAKDIEHKRYRQANINVDKGEAWQVYINANYFNGIHECDEESIAVNSYDNRVYRRIYNTLATTTFFNETLNDMEQKIKREIFLSELCKMDTMCSYLHFLNQFYQHKNYHNVKEQLLKSKYYTSFINPMVEEYLMHYDFDIPKELYLESEFYANYNDISSEYYKASRGYKVVPLCQQQIMNLLCIKDLDYSNIDKSVEVILRQCFIRAFLLFMNGDNIKEFLAEYIKKDEYLTYDQNDKISRQLIDNCFSSNEDDKKNTFSLSYKL